MNDTLYSDSSLDETINSLKDSIDKEKLLLDKQKEIDQEYKLHWYNWVSYNYSYGRNIWSFRRKNNGEVIGKNNSKESGNA